MFKITYDDTTRKKIKDIKLNSIHRAKRFFLEEQTDYHLVGPIDFSPDLNLYSLQVWFEGTEGSKGIEVSNYIGELSCKERKSLILLYNEIYDGNGIKYK